VYQPSSVLSMSTVLPAPETLTADGILNFYNAKNMKMDYYRVSLVLPTAQVIRVW